MKSDRLALVFGILLCGAVLVAVAALVYFTERAYLKPSDSIQILTLVVLVVVTFWYAISTHSINRSANEQAIAIREQAEISRKALEIALNAEKNAVLPIIRVGLGSMAGGESTSQEIQGTCSNIGRGPAINLRVWLSYQPEHTQEMVRSRIEATGTLPVGESRNLTWRSESGAGTLPGTRSRFDIVAKYSDIYGRTFESVVRHQNINVHEAFFDAFGDQV